jgi:hypothetical protein
VDLALSIQVPLPVAGIVCSIPSTTREERKHRYEHDGTLAVNHAEASKGDQVLGWVSAVGIGRVGKMTSAGGPGRSIDCRTLVMLYRR